ncbi:MAG: metal-sulfur cluster assembly factor [Deltaproteobacteria bacterium]|nr:metal-sulfur cluster assembly factor [Deltaproteobacteria bacterium]
MTENTTTPTSVSDAGGGVSPEALLDAIRPIMDPEVGLSIVDMGLIYRTELLPDGTAHVLHTLTSPMCPLGPQIMNEIHQTLARLPGVKDVKVEVTFNPPWDPKTMASDDVKLMLGIF